MTVRRERSQQALVIIFIGFAAAAALAASASLWQLRPALLAAFGTPHFLESTAVAPDQSRTPAPSDPVPSATPAPTDAPSPTSASASILPHVRFLPAALASWSIPTEVRVARIAGDGASYRLAVDGTENGSWRIPVEDAARLQLRLPTDDAYRFSLQRRSASGRWEPVSELGPLALQRLDDATSGATYQGAWSLARHAGYLASSVHYSARRGATARVTVDGQAFAWVGPSGPTRGVADVIVDGIPITSVDTFATRFEVRRLLFAYAWPVSGRHTIEVRVRATPGRPMVAVDGFLVFGPAP